jgi:methylphosphotriester-DNA--protein-cysteine methyltransferase
MIRHRQISDGDLRSAIRKGEVLFGGNRKGKIYGTLGCARGKMMKRETRVFFSSEAEAAANGYRPCACCMKRKYQIWKDETF